MTLLGILIAFAMMPTPPERLYCAWVCAQRQQTRACVLALIPAAMPMVAGMSFCSRGVIFACSGCAPWNRHRREVKTGVPLATARVLGQTRRRKTYAQKSGSFLASLLAIKDRERDPSPVEAAAP